MPQVKIEPVKIEEIKFLAEISKKTFYETFNEQNSKEDMDLALRDSFNEEKLTRELSAAGNFFFFAKTENDIAGYLKLTDIETPAELKESDSLEISRIYVSKESIGFGVGKALMNFSIAYAEKLDKKIIWLGVWEHNAHAINFYKKFGFDKFGQHNFLLGKDVQTDWLMKRNLG